MAIFHPDFGVMLEQYVRQFLEKGNSVVATARSLAQAAELHNLAKKESKLMLTEVDVSSMDSIRVISSMHMHIDHSIPMNASRFCRWQSTCTAENSVQCQQRCERRRRKDRDETFAILMPSWCAGLGKKAERRGDAS